MRALAILFFLVLNAITLILALLTRVPQVVLAGIMLASFMPYLLVIKYFERWSTHSRSTGEQRRRFSTTPIPKGAFMTSQVLPVIFLCVLAVLVNFLVESIGYAVAHTLGLFVIALLIDPGLALTFFDIGASDRAFFALSSAITAGYYMFLYFGIRRLKR
ncbi:hypothetical protein CDL60_24710 [Roseateles noduli]|nr:hypothetical protein CDL60_24710 [Roseateles noduli]